MEASLLVWAQERIPFPYDVMFGQDLNSEYELTTQGEKGAF